MARILSISEAAAEAGVSLDTLRYYERAGLMLDPVARAESGHRRYSERDVRWVVFLTKVRRTGMSIRRMRDYAALVRAGQGNEQQRLALLEAHREEVLQRVQETERNLREIERKIGTYRDRISVLENEFVDQAVRVA
jgi:DNA-binding transcriptional MerR regulator